MGIRETGMTGLTCHAVPEPTLRERFQSHLQLELGGLLEKVKAIIRSLMAGTAEIQL